MKWVNDRPYEPKPGQVQRPTANPYQVSSTPEPKPQPTQTKVKRKGKVDPRWVSKVGAWLTASILFSLIWLGAAFTIGLTGNLALDLAFYAVGMVVFFADYILTDHGFSWAEKYCTFWRR